MNIVFFVRGKKCGMENGVDSLLGEEFETVIEGSQDFFDLEWSFTFQGKFLTFMSEFQVLCF